MKRLFLMMTGLLGVFCLSARMVGGLENGRVSVRFDDRQQATMNRVAE